MSGENRNLAQLAEGQQAVIGKMDVPWTLRERLTSLGILEGTRVRCLGAGPLGDPVAYEVRSAVIALRKADSYGIEVQ